MHIATHWFPVSVEVPLRGTFLAPLKGQAARTFGPLAWPLTRHRVCDPTDLYEVLHPESVNSYGYILKTQQNIITFQQKAAAHLRKTVPARLETFEVIEEGGLLEKLESAAVVGRGAIPADGGAMLARGVPFVAVPAILRVFESEPLHEFVTMSLGEY